MTNYKLEMENALLALAKNENIEHLYDNIVDSSLLSLPENINKFLDALNVSNPYIYKMLNPFHMFNSLFLSFRINCVIKYTMENLSEPELTHDKIINIYKRFAEDRVSTDWAATEEIQKFTNFINILNS